MRGPHRSSAIRSNPQEYLANAFRVSIHSNETGRYEVYVRAFPSGEGRWQVSTSGGLFPRWQRDSRTLFFIAGQQGRSSVTIAKLDVRSGVGAFASSMPQLLFDANIGLAAVSHISKRYGPTQERSAAARVFRRDAVAASRLQITISRLVFIDLQ